MTTVAALTRLRSLPDIFRGSDLSMRFGWSSKTSSQYLFLWRRRELVVPFGGHSDVFANLVVSPYPYWDRALVMAMPSAVVIGIECLRRAGWTTQIPHVVEAAVLASSTVFRTVHFKIERRASSWFKSVRPGIVLVDASDHAARELHPTWALVDMIQRDGWGGCGLTPDDVAWPALKPRDRCQLVRAMRALDLDDEVLARASRQSKP